MMTREEFINKSIRVHGDKYDYSRVVFNGTKKKVEIICKKHGKAFLQLANNHLHGNGCPLCARELPQFGHRNLICGVGINDSSTALKNGNHRKDRSYYIWHSMIVRCYDEKNLCKYPTYRGVIVCEEWHKYSNFKKWYDDNYVEGHQLDKDILVKGNKEYSPEKCCFVPLEINTLFTKTNALRGDLPIGVQHYGKGRFMARINEYGGRKYCGIYNSVQEAFSAYKVEKERYIKERANEFYSKNLINKRVYDALLNYEVEITD